MRERYWAILAYGGILVPVAALFSYCAFTTLLTPFPRNHEPDYYAVYEVESTLYLGSTCGKAALVYDQLAPNLVECREGGLPVFVNKKNGTVLLVKNNFKIKDRWLPNGRRVFVDYDNGYVFWAEGGKVTDFVKLDPTLDAQLLRSPPEPAERSSAPGKDESQGGGVRPVQHTKTYKSHPTHGASGCSRDSVRGRSL